MKFCEILHFPFSAKTNPNGGENPTSAWELWRHENIDAEDAATLCGENPWETAGELLTRKAQATPVRKSPTPAMIRGREVRPQAIDAYRKLSGLRDLKGYNLANKARPWMIAHPDLMDLRSLHVAEIHVGESSLRKALETGKLPQPYWAEAQHTLVVSGLKFLHVYFHNTDPAGRAKTFKVWASERYQAEMIQKEEAFMAALKTERERLANLPKPEEIASVQLAIQRKGPRVSREHYRKIVPVFLTPDGNPTEEGKSLLTAA